jgi:type I restriction enzyme M protein
MVLTNPPFGKKSSFTIIGADGKTQTDKISYKRQDFWATTSNKQLNFVQHVHSMIKENGRAAMVVPDNVLFEGGAGEKIRRELLKKCDVHTLLRLPVGIWYSPGVQANVLFFDKKSSSNGPATKKVWIYDLRTNQNFSIKQNPITSADLADFIKCYKANNRGLRKETEHFRCFPYSEIVNRDKASLDIHWGEGSVELSTIPNSHQALLNEILNDLAEAMSEFAELSRELK